MSWYEGRKRIKIRRTTLAVDFIRQIGEVVTVGEPRVRFALPDDEADCLKFDRHLPKGQLARKIAAKEVLLAEKNGDPIGYLRLEYFWGKIPYIAMIHVASTQRGQGNGKAMLGFLEEYLRGSGHQTLMSSSQVDEASPQAWHRRVGFQECGILAGINEGGVGEVFFRKSL